ncbi:TOBE domain-containing protein [Helicobacter sp. 23-1046]
MNISARNQIKGKITDIQKGSVNAIVKIDISDGNTISATVSLESISELGLSVGKEAYAIIKATSVIVGTK